MYIPKVFAETNVARLQAFIQRHSFATLVTCVDGRSGAARLEASHVPLLLDAPRGPLGTLRGHLARANPQWRQFRPDAEVLAIFGGPHAFISSNCYEDPANMVPTWNYAAVHVYGTPRLIEDAGQLYSLLDDMMAYYQPEGNPMPLDPPSATARELVRGIVGFEIAVTRWEGKFKLSQNRSEQDRERARQALLTRGSPDDRAVAQLMQEQESRHGPAGS